jgi:hypothetical protein
MSAYYEMDAEGVKMDVEGDKMDVEGDKMDVEGDYEEGEWVEGEPIYPGDSVAERLHNRKTGQRLEQLYMKPVSRPPKQFKVIISCHGSYPIARTQVKSLIQVFKETSEMDWHLIRGREQQYIPDFLTAIKFYVSSSHVLASILPANTETLREANIPYNRSERQFQVDYQNRDDHMIKEGVKTMMRLFCNDRPELIITHRPTVPGRMWLRPIALSFNPEGNPNSTKYFKESFGLWICSAGNIPEKIKGWKDRDIMSNNYRHTWEDIIRWSTEALVDAGLRNGDTYEICLIACRPEPGLEGTPTVVKYVDTTKPDSEVPRQHYTALRGGREPQPLKKDLVQIKEDIKEKEREELDATGIVQVTEEQFEYFSEGNSIPKVIDHLTDENVESIIARTPEIGTSVGIRDLSGEQRSERAQEFRTDKEMSKMSEVNGGSKIRKIINRRTKRNKKYTTTRNKKYKTTRNKTYKTTRNKKSINPFKTKTMRN